VLSGLKAGEEIMLTPPLGQAGPPEEAVVDETAAAPGPASAGETHAPQGEREEMTRQRMESMTPEQREEFQRRRERGEGGRSGRHEGRP
ncbi:MAG: hypothetical protein WBE26_11020, partial [Phycisphaerae bacterium]